MIVGKWKIQFTVIRKSIRKTVERMRLMALSLSSAYDQTSIKVNFGPNIKSLGHFFTRLRQSSTRLCETLKAL